MLLTALLLTSCEPRTACDIDWPEVVIDDGLVVFDPVRPGRVAMASVTLRNEGGRATELSVVWEESDDSAFSANLERLTLEPLAQAELTIQFATTQQGTYLAAPALSTSGDHETTWHDLGRHLLALAGTSTFAWLAASPSRVDLGMVGTGEAVSLGVELSVGGLVPAQLGHAEPDGCPEEFSVAQDWTTDDSLEPGEATSLTVEYTAADPGELACAIRVAFDGGEFVVPVVANSTAEPGSAQYDDDGDGYSENDGDCDDAEAQVNPAAVEVCDGVDNDCNGLRDSEDGCLESKSEPRIAGIQTSTLSVVQGGCVTLGALVYDVDGQEPSYAWEQDSALTAQGWQGIDDPTASTIHWCLPQLDEGSQGEAYNIYLVVTDEDGNADWAFHDVRVYPGPICVE